MGRESLNIFAGKNPFLSRVVCCNGIRASVITAFSTPVILTMLIAVFNVSFANADVLYVLTGSSIRSRPNFPSFGTVDVTTGRYTEIQSGLAIERVRNLSWNPSLSAFYTIAGDADEQPVLLSVINTNGTITTNASAMGSRTVDGMAYRQSDSTIYAIDTDGNDYGSIDTGTGAWTNLQTSGHGVPDDGRSGGRFAIHNDTLYLTGFNGTTGVFGSMGYTSLSTFTLLNSSNLFRSMVLASNGTTLFGIYGDATAGNQALYSIDPTSGTASFITGIYGDGLGTRFYGADFGPDSQAVPEPSMCFIGLCGLAYAGFSRRFKGKGTGRSSGSMKPTGCETETEP